MSEFAPKWFSPPGDSIAVFLERNGLTIEDLARHLNVGKSAAVQFLEGLNSIDEASADALASFVGGSPNFWMERDRQYQSDLGRVRDSLELSNEEFVSQFPLSELQKIGLRKYSDETEQSRELIQFFGFESAVLCQQNLQRALEGVAFRKSKAFTPEAGATYAWLRICELASYEIDCAPLDVEGFRNSLSEIRGLTKLKEPAAFIPKLQEICAKNGVAVVVERAPKGCTVSGATKFLKGNRAMIALSFRYLSDDQFWFTFFHEAGHVVLHDRSRVFLESSDSEKDALEFEADAFAAETLIPRQYLEQLHRLKSRSKEIIRFAVKVGIAPGIVVGQLQHLGILGYEQQNGLKRRFKWVG